VNGLWLLKSRGELYFKTLEGCDILRWFESFEWDSRGYFAWGVAFPLNSSLESRLSRVLPFLEAGRGCKSVCMNTKKPIHVITARDLNAIRIEI
jgi:hypothetical protein